MANGSEPETALDKLCFIISLAREFDVKVDPSELNPGSNPAADKQSAVLEDHEDDPSEQELRVFIDELDEDEQIDLVTLMWIGRGDGEPADWTALRNEAANAHNDRTSDYLMGIPLLAEHQESGLDAFGLAYET